MVHFLLKFKWETTLLGLGLILSGCDIKVSPATRLPSSSSTFATLSILSVNPKLGSASGGTRVTITGKGLTGVTQVKFGAAPCSNLDVMSSTQLQCNTPAGISGDTDIFVFKNSEVSGLPSAFSYTLGAPTVTSVSPAAGALSGGGLLTLTGTNFATWAQAIVGGALCTNVVIVSNTQMTCTLPSGTAGVKNIVVTNPDGQSSTLTSGYTYQLGPSLSSAIPPSGSMTGGTLVTLIGSNFMSGVSVLIGGVLVTDLIKDSATQIRLWTPASSTTGAKTVVITNPDGQSVTQEQAWTYLKAPTLTSVFPAMGPPTGNTLISITGDTFIDPMTVTVGGNPCSAVSVVSPTQMTCLTPPGISGPATVVVKNSANLQAMLPLAFNYQSTLKISSVYPPVGPVVGGNDVSINGEGFQTGAQAQIGSVPCISVTYVNPNVLTCRIPTKPSSGISYSVTVKNLDNQTVTLPNGYRYQSPPVVVNVGSVTPNGAYNQGKSISIQVTFSEAVTVAGAPYLLLETGTNKAQAPYASGSGTSTLSFTYTVGANENSSDLDVVWSDSLKLNGGTIVAGNGDTVDATLPVPGSTYSLGLNKNIVIDTIPPDNPTITIANGQAFTNLKIVDLTLSAVGAAYMYVTKDSTCSSGGSYEVFNSTKQGWILGSFNTLTGVYVKYKDQAGNESGCVGDTIIHDDIKPGTPTLDILTKTFNANFGVTASENGSDTNFKEFRYTKTGVAPASCSDGTATSGVIPITESRNIILKVIACDFAGNGSLIPATGTYTYDGQKPTLTSVSISPTSPAGNTTPTANFTLNKDAKVNLFSDLSCSSEIATETDFTSGAKSLTVNPALTVDGTYSIYGRAIDSLSNQSDCTPMGTYILDRSKPQFTNLSISPTSPASNKIPTANFTLNKLADVTLYRETCQSSNALSQTTTLNGTATLQLNPLSTDRIYHVFIQGKSSAGIFSDCIKVGDYTLDTVAPQVTAVSFSPLSPSGDPNPIANFTLSEQANVKLFSNASCTAALSDQALKEGSTPQTLPFYTLSVDQTYSVYMKATDLAGNFACVSLGNYQLDRSNPVLSQFSFNPVSPSSNASPAVNFSLNKSATVTFYRDTCDVINTISASSVKNSGANSLLINLPQSDGVYAVFGKAVDTSSNSSSCTLVGNFTLDTVAPISPTLMINSGAAYTNSSLVDLNLSAVGADKMYVSNDPTCSSGGSWESYSISKTGWAIANAQKNTTAAVYVKYKDLAGNETSCVSDTIIHDDIKPVTPVLDIASKSFNSPFTVTATQGTPLDSNFKEFRYTKSGTAPASCSDGLGTGGAIPINEITNVTLTVIACDLAGNFSLSQAVGSYSFSNAKPSVQLTTTNSNPTNTALAVTATFSSDVTGFDLTDLAVTNGSASSFVSVSAKVYTFTVTPSADGTVTVQVPANSAQDSVPNLNNASNILSVTYDGTIPTVDTFVVNPTSPSGNANPTVSFNLSEAVKEVRLYSSNACSSSAVFSAAASKPSGNQSLSMALSSDGNYDVYIKAIDYANNSSGCVSVGRYTLDTLLPQLSQFSFTPNSPASSASPLVNFTLNKQATVTFYKDNCTTGTPLSAATSKASGPQSLLLSLTSDGTYAVFGQAVDSTNKTSGCISVGSYTLDTVAPVAPSIVINNNESYTNLSLVNLTLAASGADFMYVTNDSTCASGGVYETYTTSKNGWALDSAQLNHVAAVYVKFKDAAGNTTACVGDTIIHDNIKPNTPSLDITAKNFNANFNVAATQGSPTDSNFKGFRYTKNGIAPTSCADGTASSGTIVINDTSNVALKVIACDYAGNFSNAAGGTYTYNITKPTVLLTTTSPNPTKAAIPVTATFSVDVTGFDVTKLAGTAITNGTAGNFVASSRSVYTFTVTPTADGDVIIQIPAGVAQDDIGNTSSASVPLRVAYDGTAPDLAGFSFTPTSPSSNATPSLNFTLTENNQATVILYSSNSCTGTKLSAVSPLLQSGSRSLALTTLTTQGTYPVYAQATDTAGNQSTCKSAGSYVLDNTKPVISLPFAFSPGTFSNSPTPAVSFTLSKSSTVTLYKDSCTGTVLSAPTPLTVAGTSEIKEVTFNTISTEGTYAVFAKALDTAGNASDCASLGNYQYDKTKPQVSAFSFDPVSPGFSTTPKLNLTVSEDASVTLFSSSNCIVGTEMAAPTSLARGAGSVPLTPLSTDGTYAVNVKATDLAGNVGDCTLAGSYVLDRSVPEIKGPFTYTPTSPSNNPTPKLSFNLNKASTVTLYKDGNCLSTNSISVSKVFASSGLSEMTLNALTTDGNYNVFGKAIDSSSNASACTPMGSFSFDSTAPKLTAVSISPASPTINSTPTATFTIDEGATVTLYQTSCTGTAISSPQPFSGAGTYTLQVSPALADNIYTIFANAIDTAGNSSCTQVALNYTIAASGPGSPAITINNGDAYTKNLSVNLALSATGNPTQMVLGIGSCPVTSSSTVWSSYIASKSYSLDSTKCVSGVCTVFVKYRNALLAESACASDDITYDTVAPVPSNISIQPGTLNATAAQWQGNSKAFAVKFDLPEAATTTIFSSSSCQTSLAGPLSLAKGSNSVSIDLGTASINPVYLYGTFVDGGGNATNCTSLAAYKWDLIAPVVTLGTITPVSPTKTTTLSVPYSITEPSTVTLYKTSCTSGNEISAPLSYPSTTGTSQTVTSNVLSIGVYDIYLGAVDLFGNPVCKSVRTGHTVDLIGPGLTGISIAPAAPTNNLYPLVSFTSDEAGTVNFYANRYGSCVNDGITCGGVAINMLQPNGVTYLTNPLPIINGANNVTISPYATYYPSQGICAQTKDSLGNTKCFSVADNYYIDTVAPTLGTLSISPSVAISATSPPQYLGNSTPTVSFASLSETADVKLFFSKTNVADTTACSNPNIGTALTDWIRLNAGPQSLKVTSGLTNGQYYTLYASAKDLAGNTLAPPNCSVVKANYKVDTVAPTVTIYQWYPASPNVTGVVNVPYSLNKTGTAQLFSDSACKNPISSLSTSVSGSNSILSDRLFPGTYDIYIQGVDLVGNSSPCLAAVSGYVIPPPSFIGTVTFNPPNPNPSRTLSVTYTLNATGTTQLFKDSMCSSAISDLSASTSAGVANTLTTYKQDRGKIDIFIKGWDDRNTPSECTQIAVQFQFEPLACGDVGNGCYDNVNVMANQWAKLPDDTLIELVPAYKPTTGTGFSVWRNQNGAQILNANGLWPTDGTTAWQKRLNPDGKGFQGDFDDSTQIAKLAGRVCPYHVFMNDSSGTQPNAPTSTGKCVYYDSATVQGKLGGTTGVAGIDYLNSSWALNGSNWYEGNIAQCSQTARGMRLPTLYEMDVAQSTLTATNRARFPIGDGWLTAPMFSSEDPSGTSKGVPWAANSYSWTASAAIYSSLTSYYFYGSTGNIYIQTTIYPQFYIRCILPSSYP